MEHSERRGVERFDLELPAKIRVLAADAAAAEIEVHTENISCGGAFFRTASPLPEGTDVRIDLVLNLDKLRSVRADVRHVHIELKGTVNRSESTGMSICFRSDYQLRPLQSEKNN
ncbi:MAG: PilZ domain-containing protein [Desulfobacterales bacterium]|jgi:c-di-GMP-binding flagellar brake protein YcgR